MVQLKYIAIVSVSLNVFLLYLLVEKSHFSATEVIANIDRMPNTGKSESIVIQKAPVPKVPVSVKPYVRDPLAVAKDKFFSLIPTTPSDKFHRHHYEWAYYRYLYAHTFKRPKMLEIGLGCDVGWGPGHSVDFWLRYFDHKVDLWVFEFEEKCLNNYTAKLNNKTLWKNFNYTNVHVFLGNQEKELDLNRFLVTSGGKFDIIVDDGGHSVLGQATSLKVLFPHMNPGGNYILEDVELGHHGEVLKPLLRQLVPVDYGPNTMNLTLDRTQLMSMDCFKDLCVFNRFP